MARFIPDGESYGVRNGFVNLMQAVDAAVGVGYDTRGNTNARPEFLAFNFVFTPELENISYNVFSADNTNQFSL